MERRVSHKIDDEYNIFCIMHQSLRSHKKLKDAFFRHPRECGNPVFSGISGLPLQFIPHLMRGGSDEFWDFLRGVSIIAVQKKRNISVLAE
jgi:hypothetical protein